MLTTPSRQPQQLAQQGQVRLPSRCHVRPQLPPQDWALTPEPGHCPVLSRALSAQDQAFPPHGVLAVHMFIDRHKQLRATARATDYLQASAITRIPSYRYRYQRRSRSSSRSTEPSHSRDASPVGIKGFNTLPSTEISMYTLSRDPLKAATTPTATYNSDRDNSFLQVHNCIQTENKDSLHSNTANRRTTPV